MQTETTRRLVELRGKRSQAEVAQGIGISKSALGMYEMGERVPRDQIKVAIANYYGVTVGSLFFNEDAHR